MKRGSRAEWSVLPGPAWVPWDQYAWELGHQGWGGCVSEVLERPNKSSPFRRGSAWSA